MRFRIGPVPEDPDFRPETEGWTLLREPRPGLMMSVAIPLGTLMAGALAVGWSRIVPLAAPVDGFTLSITLPALAVALLAIGAFIVAHESLHAVPVLIAGSGEHIVVGFWPRYLAPYVAYLGALPKRVQLLCGAMPLLVLTVLPVPIALAVPASAPWMAGISILNMLGSSADLIMIALIARQVPSGAETRNQGHATWWRRPVGRTLSG